jgi:hypothetical protein
MIINQYNLISIRQIFFAKVHFFFNSLVRETKNILKGFFICFGISTQKSYLLLWFVICFIEIFDF